MSPARRLAALLAAGALALAARPSLAAPPGFAFLEVPAGARAAGMGGAYASVARGVEAAFWNPAGLEDVRQTQVVGAHTESFQSLRHDQFALAGQRFGGGIAASVRALYSEPIEERDELGNLIGTFGAHDLEFALGYGWRASPGVTLGATAALVRERIASESAGTWDVGFGTAWEPAGVPRLRLAASAQNLGPAAHYTIDDVPGRPVGLPAALQAGGAYGLPVATGFDLTAALETRVTRGRPPLVMLGGEVDSPAGAALRLGLRIGDATAGFSAGAGYAMKQFRVDYAFVPSRLDLEDTHRFAFSAQF